MDQPQNQILAKFDQRKMAQTIKDMKQFFDQESETLQTSVRVHTERFDENDVQEFNEFMQQLKKETFDKISRFWDQKAGSKNGTFETYNDTFQNNFQTLLENMASYKNDLTNFSKAGKQKNQKNEIQISTMVEKIKTQRRKKLCFKILKDYLAKKREKQEKLDFSERHYLTNLSKKSFLSWRSISYKPAFENKIYKTSENDVNNVQTHYIEIINALKQKLVETQDLIEIKKQAKAEFAYGLSKNIMKAISNLSMEVMSLNQMTLQDQRIDTSDSAKFIDNIQSIVQQKCSEISQLRSRIRNEAEGQQDSDIPKRSQHVIRFQEPQQVDLEKISFDRDF